MKMSATRKAIQAFTLVELSIVLVILGLLVGGVLSGQSLIHSAEIRAVTTEATKYRTATYTFRDKYFGYPGDITNAVSFWGSVTGNSSDNFTTSCYGAATTDTKTCNGNGDGLIPSTAGTGEMWHAWVQMANAGLIEGRFTGYAQPWVAPYYKPGTNIGASRLPGAGWMYLALGPNPGSIYSFAMPNPGLTLINIKTNSGGAAPSLKPEDAWNIDTKIDDGKPGTGTVIGVKMGGCTTRDGQAVDPVLDAAATYLLTSQAEGCELYLINL